MKFYPRLFENPNALYIPEIEYPVEWNETNTFPFSYYDGVMHLGAWGDTHDDMIAPPKHKGDRRGQYSGRVFADYKVITFWHFPENQETLKKVLDDLKEKIYEDKYDNYAQDHYKYDFYDGEWMIEVPEDVEKLKKYPTTKKIDNFEYAFPNWGSWHPKKDEQKYVKVKDYEKGVERSAEELAQQHVKSPLLKPKKKVEPGWGSNSERYKRKRAWQMASMTDESKKEEIYPRLFESPDWIEVEGTDEEIPWMRKGARAFGYYRDKLYVAKTRQTHGDMIVGRGQYRDRPGRELKYAGRIWPKNKYISFWYYPPKKELVKVLKDLENKLKITIINDPEWKIDVPVDMKNSTEGGYADERNYTQIPIKDYAGEYITSEEDLARQHVLSPLLKPKKKVEPGWGSNSERYKRKRAWQMATVGDESVQEPHYPRLFEVKFTQKHELWKNLYFTVITDNADAVPPKYPTLEVLRANFGPNGETAKSNIKKILTAAKIDSNSYEIKEIPKKTIDNDAKKAISGDFSSYKVKFNKQTSDVFNNNYNVDSVIFFTNRTKSSGKKGETNVIGRKDLTPDKIGLAGSKVSYANPNAVLQKVNQYLNQKTWANNYKRFILESSKYIINDSTNKNKFNNFAAYAKVTDVITYNIPIELFEGIDEVSRKNIQNDYGEVLGALMFFNILRRYGRGLRYPESSNEKMIDFYFDDYKISSKSGGGGTPGGGAIINTINEAYKRGEISFNEEWEIDFYENLINPWLNPDKLDKSEIYNSIMTLAKIHLSSLDSGYSYLISSMGIKGKPVLRENIINFIDNMATSDPNAFSKFLNTYMQKSTANFTPSALDNYKKEYVYKIKVNDGSRIGLIFYPIIVELVKILNKKYANMLTVYTQKTSDIKQLYLDVEVKKGKFKFTTYSFSNSTFVFDRKGSVNNPFGSQLGIKIKK